MDNQTKPAAPAIYGHRHANPAEYHGTFPLPESQMDRFLMRLRIGYHARRGTEGAGRPQSLHPASELQPVLTAQHILDLQAPGRKVRMEESLMDYPAGNRPPPGTPKCCLSRVSTRGASLLTKAAKALALVETEHIACPGTSRNSLRPSYPISDAQPCPRRAGEKASNRPKGDSRSAREHSGSRVTKPSTRTQDRTSQSQDMPHTMRPATTMAFQSLRLSLHRLSQHRAIRVTTEGTRLLLTLAVGIAAVNTGNNLFYLLLAMMLSLIVLSGLLSEQCVRRLEFHRHLPDALFVHQPAVASVWIANHKTQTPSVSLRILGVVGGQDADRAFTSLPCTRLNAALVPAADPAAEIPPRWHSRDHPISVRALPEESLLPRGHPDRLSGPHSTAAVAAAGLQSVGQEQALSRRRGPGTSLSTT